MIALMDRSTELSERRIWRMEHYCIRSYPQQSMRGVRRKDYIILSQSAVEIR